MTRERIFQQRYGSHYLTADICRLDTNRTRHEHRVDGKLVSQAAWLRYKRAPLSAADIAARNASIPGREG